MKHNYTPTKILAILLFISISLALLAGCAKEEEQNSAGTISDYESQAHIQVSTPDDESASGDTSREPLTGDFAVSEKKYDYKGANLMLLNVENNTNRHFNVTIHGKYLDADGKIIKEESKTYEGFPSGWSNHFIFYPKIPFDSFTYELETKEYQADELTSDENGTPLVSYIELTYEKQMEWMRGVAGGDENGHSIEARDMYFWSTLFNSHPTVKIAVEYNVLVLNAQGEIYITDFDYAEDCGIIVDFFSGGPAGPLGSEDNGKRRHEVLIKRQLKGEDETIPENVQGVFTAIFAIADVVDIEKYREQFQQENQ